MTKKLGRYELIDILGKGGMGIVCKARDPVIERIVALKVLKKREGMNAALFEQFRQRFLQEARAAGKLNHPNIVAIYDAGTDPGTGLSFLAMEYVLGKNIEQYLAVGYAFSAEEVVRISIDVAEGLDYAHDRGIIHRDIKAANIMLSQEGKAKIADFGIAKMADSQLTQTGQFLGSPAFVSPEQVAGGCVDRRSDIFSLGIVMYQMLTGEKPFTGEKMPTIIYQIMNAVPPPPKSLNPALPEPLSDIVMKAMEKKPEDRFQTAKELAEALRLCLRQKAGAAPEAAAAPAKAEMPAKAEAPAKIEVKTEVQPAAGAIPKETIDETEEQILESEMARAIETSAAGVAEQVQKTKGTKPFWTRGKAVFIGAASLMIVLAGIFLAIHFLKSKGGEATSQAVQTTSAAPSIDTAPAAPARSPARIPARTGTRASGRTPPAAGSPAPVKTPTPDATAGSQKTSEAATTSFLYVKFTHRIGSGKLVVSVDDEVVLSKALQAKKGKIPIIGGKFSREEIEESVRVAPGDHSVRVRVHEPKSELDLTRSIKGTFKERTTSILKIEVSQSDKTLNLTWEN